MKPDLTPVATDLWVLYANAPSAPWQAQLKSSSFWRSLLRLFTPSGRSRANKAMGVYADPICAMQHVSWLHSIPEDKDNCWVRRGDRWEMFPRRGLLSFNGTYFTIERLIAYYGADAVNNVGSPAEGIKVSCVLTKI